MPPKRQGNRSKKGPVSKGPDLKKEYEDASRASIPVDWAIPKAKRKNAFDRKYLDDYAQPLYEREPDELRPMQAGLPEAQIRTPIYQKDGKDMVAGDANQSSAALRDLYNEIKRLSAKEPDGLHDIAALTGQFEEGDENAAVVLSRAENQEVFVLDTERRLQVTVNDQTAHVDLIRRVPTGVGNQRLGHFIEVPLGTSITVNGITYTNQGSSSPTPFFIGPLEDFAVIELLSQPLFFFRHEGSLKYKATTRKAAQDEMERRDRNGDVARDDVIIRWLPIGSPEVTSQEVGNEAETTESMSELFQALANEQIQHEFAEVEAVEEVEEDEYSDAFTEDGRRIENPHSYFKTRLNQHLEDKVASLIPRVIASINHRQPENAGFSFIHESTVFRPDRTLLTALTQQSGRNLLLVAQVQQPEKRIRVRVLYPLFWRSSGSHLSKINQNLRRWILASGSSEQMTENLLMDTEWVPCAQTTTQEASSTYTILNAWALAMGLEPNPEFTPTRHGDEAFFIQAEGMFHLALENALTWKLLLSFLHCTEFVKPAVTRETDDDEDADLPAQDRRFDLRKRPFDTLIANQTKADETFPAKEIETKQTPVQLEDGILHSETNRSDSLSNKQLNELLPLVREGRWRLQDIAKRPEQYYYEDTETSEESFETPLPVKDSPVQPLQLDTFPVPAEFSLCEYLREELNKLANGNQINQNDQLEALTTKTPPLTKNEIRESIASVIRAVNQRHPPGAGFTTESSKTELESSITKNGDLISVYMLEATETHNLCILTQNSGPNKNTDTVIDSAPWLTSKATRAKIFSHLGSQEPITGLLKWVFAPQQAHEHHDGYHVVLNAWSILLNLPLNGGGFVSSPEFIRDARHVIQAALRGEANWLLIWALLRCHEYVASTEAPGLGRRFARTIPESEQEAYEAFMRTKKGEFVRERVNVCELFLAGSIQNHDDSFLWDRLDTEDRNTRIPELQRNGLFDSTLSRDEIRSRYATLSKHISPCESLRDTLSQLLANEEIQKELEEFRSNDIITTEKGEWLDDSESALAISAVTMAINQMQSIEEGFSIVQSQFVQLCQACGGADMENCMLDALRPGRPLLAPISFKSHIVLLLAQLDEQGRPTISFVDSLFCHYDAEDREKLFNIGWQVLRGSSWWRGVFADKNAFEKVKPKSATWVETARQPSSNECGYFTILNAWGLAMGLELNQDVRLRWTDSFFQELQDMVHLVRLGHANWKLMFDFLQCHDIVRDGIVPGNRRFSRTHSTRAEPKFDDNLANLLATEKLHWARQKYQTEALERIRNANRIPNMTGRPHNGKKAFPSDGWIDVTKKYEYVPRLQRFGLLNIDHREREMEAAFRNLSKTRVESCLKKLPPANSQSITSNQEALLQVIRDEIKLQYEGMDSDIQREPHEWIEDTLDFYDQIRKTAKLQQMLSNKGIVKPNDWQRLMEDSDLNLAMASVLEAIDNLQSGLHAASGSQHPFASGFALTTSNALQMALHGIESVPFSRPRRTWLIPLVATKNGLLEQLEVWAKTNGKKYKSPTGRAGGHAFLVVVQEAINHDPENPAETRFETHIFDSCLRIFDDVRDFFSVRVENAAASLKWSTQRNEFGAVQFDTGAFIHENLPQQMAGGFQCGHHVLINAWIIAMGLHFDPEAQYTTEIYKQLYTLAQAATAGILDWRTLAAWFFCHKLTVERTFDAVPENRRFGCTVVQRDERTLEGRITEQYAVQDAALEMFSLAQVPYDYSNNFHTENSGEDSDSSNSLFGLKRRVDDAEGDFLEKRRGIKRKWTRGLRFLDRYGEGDGEQNAGGQAGKKRRLLGHLTPLDVQD
ncbi:hypothetical protein COCC4DRAFT_135004 [Bipolaris maydis ATCC 48331]|uniref:Ubiquitin-like protease family profile domain-containing protein n=2 Tax=Cochliobolus heterostrophus TaxID=5016 RepID=M2SLS9_COCH5|nr:uncharacterized protein COCC4DRAFT_135004 [Bipolaris maydis ATCC 48331]EMD86295.1 hypothetical protein COCHEDRAFT_1115983 [Bipolaris maydis C5]ENI06241.1 hypothetical protein COCC4DRAFT_135004 [Bipolaris maydis ATCC 48331]KAJ6213921.1 hypothetical protein PSV09DRAFT_1115983 [Bipolaris maydis]KAJ6275124.1 hypothetical protein PSV08DRAFT_172705 [Bipolaris maydis]